MFHSFPLQLNYAIEIIAQLHTAEMIFNFKHVEYQLGI